MVQTKPISKTITSLDNLEERFNLHPTENEQFFPEWHQDLPELTDSELATLDQIRNRFLRHRKRGSLAEGTINHLVISPLLTLAGLYDEPFFITTEPEVELLLEDRDEFKALDESNQIYLLNHLKGRDDLRHITNLFKRLFLYRKRLDKVLIFNRGVLAASGLYFYAYRKTEDINQIIRDNLEPLDKLIGLIISSENENG